MASNFFDTAKSVKTGAEELLNRLKSDREALSQLLGSQPPALLEGVQSSRSAARVGVKKDHQAMVCQGLMAPSSHEQLPAPDLLKSSKSHL